MLLGRRARKALLRGDPSRFEALNRTALAIMERTRGETQETSVYAANLAVVLASQGRHSEAVGYYRRALTILHGLGHEHDTFKSVFPVLK